MRRASTWILLAVTAAASLAGQTASDVKLDNELVRVLQITVPPHHRSAPIEHTMNRVLIYRDAGQMTRTIAGKVEKIEFKASELQWDPAGPPYIGENITDHPIEIVEIELKNKPHNPPVVRSKLDPATADSEHYKVDFENDQVRVLRIHYGPHEKGSLHEHVGNRVVVNLGLSRKRFSDVRMSGPATHSEENASDDAADRLAVEVK